MKKDYIRKRYIEETEISDIDQDNLGEMFPEYEYDGVIRTFDKIHSYYGVAIQIKIDKLINTLTEFKERGATHVEILPHNDHNGYVFNTLEMRKATKEEVDEYHLNNKRLEKEELKSKIEAYEKMIKTLKEKYES